VERHAIENDDPFQSPKKAPTQPAVEGGFAIGEDAALLASEGLREHLEQRAVDFHEPFLLAHDATDGGQHELDQLGDSVRVEQDAVENDHDHTQSPKKDPTQLAVEEDLAVSEDATPCASEGSREHLERRAANVHEPSLFSRDANGDPQELERLITNVHALQREEAAARLPRAAQLCSVPGLASADSGFGPPHSLETEYPAPSAPMRSRPDRLRSPFTVIKISTLIVSMFAVPAAYYFWLGGWEPISNFPPERASFVPDSIMPPPMPSSQAATTVARDDDLGTPATGERRTAKSLADETVATLQTSTSGAQDPPSSTAIRPLELEQIKLLMKQGEQFIAAGDMVTARLAFQRAAEAGDANAALALGRTYDPTVLVKFGVVGISADVAEARSWYRNAEKLGSPEARQRLEVLADR